MRHHDEGSIGGAARQVERLVGDTARGGQLGPRVVDEEETPERPEPELSIGPAATELVRSTIGALDGRVGVSLDGLQRDAERDPEQGLPVIAFRTRRERPSKVDASCQMVDCLQVRPSTHGLFARALAVDDRFAHVARLLVVPCENLQLRLRQLREPRLEYLRDPAMVLLANAPQERVIRGVLDQGVLEDVARLGPDAALVKELRAGQLSECLTERRLLQRGDRCEYLELELPSQD